MGDGDVELAAREDKYGVLEILERRGPVYPEFSSGWDALIARLDGKLAALVPDYKLAQVKEKFGGLRYYYYYSCDCEGVNDCEDVNDADRKRFRELVSQAEAESFTICEVCGETGRLMNRGYWVRTLCDTCGKPEDGWEVAGDDG